MKTKNITAAVIFSLAASGAAASDFGYCVEKLNRNNVFRMGSTETQGLAIRLPQQKLQALAGASIKSVRVSLGSSRTNDGNVEVFVSTDLSGAPLLKQEFATTTAAKWVEYTFDTPYRISGDEDCLYIGYTGKIGTKASMLMSDFTDDSRDCTYVFSDGEWIDAFGLGYGNACIRAVIDEDREVTDLILKPIVVNGYFKAGATYSLKGQMYNYGTQPINSLSLSVSVGDEEPETYNYTDLDIKASEVFDFTVPGFSSSTEGVVPVKVELSNVNGGDDADSSDNLCGTPVYYYPAGMERAMLLEGFTGQDCSNCPAGHATINTFIDRELSTPIIEVMHHSGYRPDLMTMESDMDYTYFYGNPSTFAPAVMMNRTVFPSIGTVPVLNLSSKNLATAYEILEADEPYVSLGIESAFNPSTRQVDLTVRTLTHVELPADVNVLNVMLVQDGIVARQVPYGEGYVHNAVFRGALTGNSWGLTLDQSQTCSGGEAVWKSSFVLPESIFSDYWATVGVTEAQQFAFSVPTAPDNMRIVAYVGACETNNLTGHKVYNAVETKLGESYIQGGISSLPSIVTGDRHVAVEVVGRQLILKGDYDSVSVFSADGRPASLGGELAPGVYLIHASSNAGVFTSKIAIR